jgi:hypothetical protein
MQPTLKVFKSGGENIRPYYQLLLSLPIKLLGIVGSQIKIEKIFFLVVILKNLRKCKLQANNLDA